MGTKKGTIKFFSYAKGYGFIKPDEGGKDVFVHISALGNVARDLVENDVVSYDLAPSDKGLKAVEVALEK